METNKMPKKVITNVKDGSKNKNKNENTVQ